MSKADGRVLIIDPDPLVRHVCVQTLQHEGYHVEDVASAPNLSAIFDDQQSYDLLIISLVTSQPRAHLALLAAVREQNLELPILLLAREPDVRELAEAMRLGVHGLLLQPFRPDELVQTVSDLLSRRQHVRVHDRVNALRPVVRISQRLWAELNPQRLYDQIIETAKQELAADRASLMLLEETNLRIVAALGLPKAIRVGCSVPLDQGLAGWVIRHGQALVVSHGQITPRQAHVPANLLLNEPIVASIAVPLQVGERILGVLNATRLRQGPAFTEDDRALLTLLAAQAATAIENARLYADIARSEQRYRALLQHATDAVLLIDPSASTILDSNLAFEQLSGYSRSELRKLPPQQLLPELFIDNTCPTQTREIETVLQTSQERPVPVAVSLSNVPDNGQQLHLLIARDISERQRLAAQLLQAEKLAALGRVSASMAHEINNPLQAINNSIHLLLTRDLSDEKRQRYLSMTQEELTRLIDLVRRMLDFYRPSREGTRATDLNHLVNQVLALTESQLQAAHVLVKAELQADLPPTLAISSHLKQVLFSLIFNAIEAMPSGGELHIRTYLSHAHDPNTEGFIGLPGSQTRQRTDSPMVVVQLSDTGRGIAPEDLPKIFEPFFTTHMAGAGLGLAVSYSIIEQHNGELLVRSEPGQGSTFLVRLPVSDAAEEK